MSDKSLVTPSHSPSSTEDFQVVYASKPNEDTIILTTQGESEKWLENAMYKFDNNYKQYSPYLNESFLGKTTITSDELDVLMDNPQNDLEKVRRINSYVRFFINKDDLIGKIYETIESNINTEFRLSYRDFSTKKQKKNMLDKTKLLIDDFNDQINLRNLMRKSITLSYSEGNFIMYLRSKNDNYIVDHYQLGVAEVSDYEIDGEPCLLININEIKSRLQKTYKKTKKGKNLFFDKIEDEIESQYPPEVYDAFISKDSYAKLDMKRSGILRVNNMNRKYGVTPIFRTLKSSIMLDTFERTDRINAKAKGKKIIFQKLHKEIMGDKYDRKTFSEMSYAHDSFMSAWKNETVIYTGAAFVEKIEYIEPKVESTNINNVNYYRSKIMTALGIGFLNQDSKQSFTASQISITELMKTINKISEQLEDVLEKWYKVVLEENGIPLEFCPKIKLVDSEELDKELKLKLAELLYSKFNASYETSFGFLGINVEDEKQKRIKENEENYGDIFTPRLTAYTNSGDAESKGRPANNSDPDKQVQDQDRRSGQ